MERIIIGVGGPKDKASLTLLTRRKNYIHNEMRPERNPAARRAAIELHSKLHPGAKLRSSTAVYNCIGLVFASRRTWIDTTELQLIFRDDDYYKVQNLAEVEVGDVVVYKNKHEHNTTHIGLVINKTPQVKAAKWKVTVLSKWGADGEYIHSIEDVPVALGEDREYWSERK